MKGDDGWKKIIDLLKKHYSKDDNTAALETWKEFRNFTWSDQSIPWIRGPRAKKAIRKTSEQSERSGTSGRIKSKPRSNELSPSDQSGTCSWSAQSQVTRWPHHTSKQQIWQHNSCTVGLDA